MKGPFILGIECTCDDSSIAIYSQREKKIIIEESYSSSGEHTQYGGIVPEIAARAHERELFNLIESCLVKSDLKIADLSYIAYSDSPGIEGSLLVGRMIGATLATILKKKLLPINHLEAHVYSIGLTRKMSYPFLSLLISGKNSIFYLVRNEREVEILEQARDCALGEAYDKIARIMGLSYPGGALLEKYYREKLNLNRELQLTKGNRDVNRLSLNFSGLISASKRVWERMDNLKESLSLDAKREILSTLFQREVIDILCLKIKYWAKKWGILELSIVGGVSKNAVLKSELPKNLEEIGLSIYFVEDTLSEDNASMIAYRASLLI